MEIEVETSCESRAGEHSDTDEEADDGVLLLHHQLLQSLHTSTTPSEQTSLITKLRADPQFMGAVITHRRHQRQTRVRDEGTQTEDLRVFSTGEMELDGDCVDVQNVLDIMLSNTIILDKIFMFLNAPKMLRLVCKSWNSVYLSGKARLNLNVGSIRCQNPQEFEAVLETMDATLVKSLVVDELKSDGSGVVISTKLIRICTRFGLQIQEIEVSWGEEIVPLLYQILYEYCPNLRRLSVSITIRNGPPASPAKRGKGLPTLTKLKEICIIHFPRAPGNHERGFMDLSSFLGRFRRFRRFFQDLIISAPYLEKLDAKSLYIPSLDGKTNLKYLKYSAADPWFLHGNLINSQDGSITSLEDISRILDQVKGSLQSLELYCSECAPDCVVCGDRLKFNMPSMPKLRVFMNGNMSVFRLSDNLREAWNVNMPALNTLKIASNRVHGNVGGITDCLTKVYDCVGGFGNLEKGVGVNHLIVGGIRHPTCFGPLRIPFPFLEKLEVVIGLQPDMAAAFGRALKACPNLRVKHIKIISVTGYAMSGIVLALWECRNDLFKGLKILEIISKPKYPIIDDLTLYQEQVFQNVMPLMKEMQAVVFAGLLLRGSHAKRIFQCIEDNQLPIIFRNY